MAPVAFMIPKTEPECLGARSWGFTIAPMLWKPIANMQVAIKERARGKDVTCPGNTGDSA